MSTVQMSPRQAQVATGTLTSSLVSRIREQILSGALPPGERIRLEELKTSFDVSLSPVREALSRLVAERYVVSEEQKGFRVAPVSRANLLEVTQLRQELEPMALREAIRSGDDAWEANLYSAFHMLKKYELNEADSLAGNGQTLRDWEHWHRNFHYSLISGSKRPMLVQFCETLHDFNDRYRRLFLSTHAFDVNVATEHQSILRATIAREADLAASLLQQHINRTSINLIEAIGASLDA
jgi:GntR family transcriptional regulator, carbon starvation induced regulator